MTVLGLDGGGTKTVVAVADRTGRVVGFVQGAALDPTAGAAWEGRLADLTRRFAPVEAAVLGLPYYSEVPEISARQTAVARAALGPGAEVMNDVAVAYEGALGGGEGVLVLAGTGSMAWARGPDGVTRCGGWGDLFGDEGSAYWIGRAALALVSRHLDGRVVAAEFADGLLDGLKIKPDDLIGWAYRQDAPRAAIAGVARVVDGLAVAGNAEGGAILAQAAEELALMARTAARACGLPAGFAWSHAGGVFGSAVVVRQLTGAMGVAPTTARLPPVGGAVLAAAQKAGWTVDAAFVATLAATLGGEMK